MSPELQAAMAAEILARHAMPFTVLTAQEVAQYLQLPEAIVLEEATAGRLPGRCIAGQWRFLQDAIIDWLRVGEPAQQCRNKSEAVNETEAMLANIAANRQAVGTVGDWYPDEESE